MQEIQRRFPLLYINLLSICHCILSNATQISRRTSRVRTNHTVQCIVGDLGELEVEKRNPGVAYTIISRAQTLGTNFDKNGFPSDSVLYIDRTFSTKRITQLCFNNDGNVCAIVKRREDWVKHLMRCHEKIMKKYTRKSSCNMLKDASTMS